MRFLLMSQGIGYVIATCQKILDFCHGENGVNDEKFFAIFADVTNSAKIARIPILV
jgi:hypothetical protein